MFSDLVGSTALSARMDPEDLREVISAYQKCVAETVQRFGGFVAKYMGDGVLVYFGYPQAHEDDAERAVRAGLELIQAVGGLKSSAPLRTRVGIATGLVVVGDLIGSGAAQEQAVVGETPNLAARLQNIAEPNTVVIAESTRKLLSLLRTTPARKLCALRTIAHRMRLQPVAFMMAAMVKSAGAELCSSYAFEGDPDVQAFWVSERSSARWANFLGLLWRATVNSDGRKASFADAQRPRPRGHSALIENITC